MIDHAFGRPDSRYRKYQVLTVVALWSAFVYAKPHGPQPVSRLSRFLSPRITIWQAIVLTCLTEYVRRDFKKLVPWLESPEPLSDMYNRDYFRATWITTALDAGFWTAMRVRPKWLRDIASMVFAAYYLVCADQADEMVRKVRGKLSLDHLRVSWNKGTSPYLAFFNKHLRPSRLCMRYKPRRIRIPRADESPYKDPVHAWLYYDGPIEELKSHDKIILDIPGGGFVAMDPRCHDDKLMAWAAKTGLPIVSLDYRKAPEHPYPYALNECFDAYYSIVASHGRLIGLAGDCAPKIIISGDSAGGNLAVGTILMMLQSRPGVGGRDRKRSRKLPLPEALILIYPALDVQMSSWLTDEQSALIKDPTRRKANKGVVRRLDEDYRSIINTPMPSDDELEDDELRMTPFRRTKSTATIRKPTKSKTSQSNGDMPTPGQPSSTTTHPEDSPSINALAKQISNAKPKPISTRLEMTSMISYVDDRILSPEMLRAMVVLYLGEHKRPDFSTEYLLSPLRAPEELLRDFPKVYMLTGERDPLVDDTVLFAGRLLEAHLHKFQARKEAGTIPEEMEFVDSDYVHYELVPGVSHGFLQFAPVYPRGYRLIETCSTWMKKVFEEADEAEESLNNNINNPRHDGQRGRPNPLEESGSEDYFSPTAPEANTRRPRVAEDQPLMMSSHPSSSTTTNNGRRLSGSGSGSSAAAGGMDRRDASGKGKIRKPAFSGRRSPVLTRTNRSALNLTSLDDVMERRMGEVVRPLKGDEQRPKTPN